MTENERKAIERGEKRDRRVREATRLLEAGVETILDGDELKRYLAFAARFHRYSANNSLLILLQRPGATRVAGYRRWRDLGRQVRRGEEGLKILAPIFRTVEDEESGEKERVLCSFKVVKVFDVSQTDPVPGAEPIPEKPRPRTLPGDSDLARALGRSLLAFCGCEGVPVSEDDAELDALSPGANGLYSLREKRILLRSTLSADGRAKTLAHELAHHLLHRGLLPRRKIVPPSRSRPKERPTRCSRTSASTPPGTPSPTWRAGPRARRWLRPHSPTSRRPSGRS